MRRVWRLVQQEFRAQAAALFAALGLMAVLEAVLFLLESRTVEGQLQPAFETVVDGSGIAAVFVCALAVALGLQIWGLARNFAPTKSIYALLTLPIHRRWVYLSKLCVAMLSMLCLWCAQLGMVLAFHRAYASTLAAAVPRGSLYLSFFRSAFLRLVFPPEPISALTALLVLCAMAAFVLATTVNLRAGQPRWVLYLVLTTWPLAYRLFPLMSYAPIMGLWKLLMPVLMIVAYSVIGIQPLRRGEVSV